MLCVPVKKKTYTRALFAPDVIRTALGIFTELGRKYVGQYFPAEAETWTAAPCTFEVWTSEEQWTFESVEEALAEYRKGCIRAYFKASVSVKNSYLEFQYLGYCTNIAISFPERAEVERVFGVFEENLSSSLIPEVELNRRIEDTVTIFIGHGRSSAWRDLKDHLQDKHKFRVSAFETGVRAGQSIQAILGEMVKESSLAFLVHTAEDADNTGLVHARENVVHETGLFQGRLGFSRAIILREDGCESFSNVAGTQELRFQPGNIQALFGDILAIIKREFGGSP